MYEITVPKDHRIILNFNNLELQLSISGHCYDYLQISTSVASPKEKTICGQNTTMAERTFESSENWMRIVFSSDHVKQYSGFSASYTTRKSCSNITYESDNGILTSINYPENYLNHQECSTLINISNPSQVIYLQFEQLHIEVISDTSYYSNLQCSKDYVEIYDGVTTYRRCGNWLGHESELRFRSHGTWFLITFVTDVSGTASGFKAVWKAVENDTARIDCSPGWYSFQDYCYKVRQ